MNMIVSEIIEEFKRIVRIFRSIDPELDFISVPWPVSLNRMYRVGKGRVMIHPQAKEYKRRMLRKAMVERWPSKYGVQNVPFASLMVCYMPDQRARDLDNLPKLILDTLQSAGIIDDDKNNQVQLMVKIGVDKENPRVEVAIVPLSSGE